MVQQTITTKLTISGNKDISTILLGQYAHFQPNAKNESPFSPGYMVTEADEY